MLVALLWNLFLTTAMAAALAGLCRMAWLRRRPALVHWLWLLLLVKLVTPPLLPIPLLPAVGTTEKASANPVPASLSADDERATVSRLPREALDHGVPLAVEQSRNDPWLSQGATPGVSESVFPAGTLHGTSTSPYAWGLLALSLIGSIVVMTVYGQRALKFHRWLKRAGAEDPALEECCVAVASRMGVRGELRSCVVDTRTTPLLWGWHRPLVVIPRQLLDELHPEQLVAIVAHEAAHLVRGDHWANLFVCFVRTLMWWNPVVWWVDRELRVAQELCCDAIAIDRSKARRSTYAATLLRTLDFIQSSAVASPLALGMGASGTILRRFEMIAETELSYRMSRWATLGVLLLGIALACMPVRALETQPPLFSRRTLLKRTPQYLQPRRREPELRRHRRQRRTRSIALPEISLQPRGNACMPGQAKRL